MTEIAVKREGAQRMGFFTDTTVCIGCKACEVACKQWNDLPSDGGTFRKGGSYDSTGRLSGNTWRHVFAPSSPVWSYEPPLRNSLPSAGRSFHCLHATSHALQPMQTVVSV